MWHHRNGQLLLFLALILVFIGRHIADSKDSDAVAPLSDERLSQQLQQQQQGNAPFLVQDISATVTTLTSNVGDKQQKIAAENVSLGFYHAFFASLSVIIVSELGDKTWFIAAIMAMRHSRLTVFLGAMSALGLMTVLSACLGWATQIIPRIYTYYISTALFALFGIKMLFEGWKMSPNMAQEEYEDANAEVQKKELQMQQLPDIESGGVASTNSRRAIFRFVSRIFLEAFTLTFLAEWGDRSQLTTIILAAREDVVGVSIGGFIGHCICTGIAVLGGRLVAQQISVRTEWYCYLFSVTIIGGIVFIVFALSAFFVNSDAS